MLIQGKYEEAIKNYQMTLEIDPLNDWANKGKKGIGKQLIL